MNKQGQLVLVGMMIAFAMFVTLVALVEPIKDQSSAARTNLNCTSTELSAGESGACIVTDSYLLLYAGISIAVALGFIGLKRLGGGLSGES